MKSSVVTIKSELRLFPKVKWIRTDQVGLLFHDQFICKYPAWFSFVFVP